MSAFRSSQYDALLAAEAKAEKSKKGLFADKVLGDKGPILRIQELQGVSQLVFYILLIIFWSICIIFFK